MFDVVVGEVFLVVGDFKCGYFIVDYIIGVCICFDNIIESGFYKVYIDKYLGGGVVDFNVIKVFEFFGLGF